MHAYVYTYMFENKDKNKIKTKTDKQGGKEKTDKKGVSDINEVLTNNGRQTAIKYLICIKIRSPLL